jgi:hypothetical protein
LTKIRTINVMEWINKELKRRSKVLGLSIEGMSIEIDIILIGITEDWMVGSRYNNNNNNNNNNNSNNDDETMLNKRILDSIEHILQKVRYIACLLFLHIFSGFSSLNIISASI